MATNGVLGNGCKVGYSTASPVNWTKIPQLMDCKIPTYVADDVSIDTHRTDNNLHKKMQGMINVGDPTFTLLYDGDETTTPSHDAMYDYNANGQDIWWCFELPVNRAKTKFKAFIFLASVKSVEPSTPIADKESLVVALKFDGDSIQRLPAGASLLG